MRRCPSCKGPVRSREENEAFPFCSSRCRAVDLGRWFTGAYRVPGEPAEKDERPDEPESSRESSQD